MKTLRAITACLLLIAPVSCVNIPSKMHITVDVNIKKVDEDLKDFFSFEENLDPSAPPANVEQL